MSTYKWEENTYKWEQAVSPRCVYADMFYRTARDAIFAKLTEATTAKQFEAAQESLFLLRQELETDMPAMHFASLIGRHLCVKDVYKEATARLRSLALLQPEPAPPPPPEPQEPQPPLTHGDVENIFHSLPPETYFGTERDEDDSE
jgi:hypothetical protein